MSLQIKGTGELLIKGNGALMNSCCCGPVCADLIDDISIVGYFDGMFVPFDPYAPQVNAALFNGVMTPGQACIIYGPTFCQYHAKVVSSGANTTLILNGNAPGFGWNAIPCVFYNATFSRWEFMIKTSSLSDFPNTLMCFYVGPSGPSPLGVYTKVPLDYTWCLLSNVVAGTAPASITFA